MDVRQGPAKGRPLRRQVLVAIVGVTALAIVLFALPLAVAVQRLYRDEAITRLQRDATRVAAVVPDDINHQPRPVPRLAGLSPQLAIGVYRLDGGRLTGTGPSVSPLAAQSHDGRVHDGLERGQLAVSAPVASDGGINTVVRVSAPYDLTTDRVERTWLAMAGLAVLVIGCAALLAQYQARRLALPLERLTAAAQQLGGGDFSVHTRRSGLREADAAGLALEATARRLGAVLDRERAFSADVSHQLRTPLTGLLLGLESALERPGADLRAAIGTALERGRRLQSIIDDLLDLARDSEPAHQVLNVPALLEQARRRWHGPLAAQGRRLDIEIRRPLPQVRAAPAALSQIMDVLLDNALEHGRGRVTVRAGDVGDGLAIDVTDQGPGIPDDAPDVFARRSPRPPDGDTPSAGHGIGLALARSLAEAEGGRLVLGSPRPPVFTLLLPADDTYPDQDVHPVVS
ncbi:Signal transduction histidine kinase [Thermomonospora echinospora]|uniref:histidine kinase n=1 Tax=Thermomonospora echinospora TaxID=1992 RepID=A0A1H6AVM7_9ACTN|nr:HAMP domain-containing sensor histidine kinase [Thermomonospora echinospora]SEG52718.1 Signal transduction histidine kinase [Thermomonospora echinospora]